MSLLCGRMLFLQNTTYSSEQLKENGEAIAAVQPSAQMKQAVLFCHSWLSNRQEFTFHTSGSTGVPRQIHALRTQLQASAQGTIDYLKLTADEHIYVCLNTDVIAGAMMLVRGLELGCSITVAELSSDPLKELPLRHGYTFVSFVPLQLKGLLTGDADAITKLNGFRHILVGGGSIHEQMEERLAQLHTKVFHTYGMTETLSHIALKQVGAEDVFSALPGVQVRTDARGCLEVKAPVTGNEWITTNDVAELVGSDQFHILGRTDDVINTGGLKFYVSQIEESIRRALQPEASLIDFFVYGIKDESLGQKIIAVFESGHFSGEQIAEIREQVSVDISPYAVPKAFYFVPAFEKTQSGKINKPLVLNKLAV